jgi:predicted acetyltransferase
MEGPRACKREELNQVIALINKTFRTTFEFNPTMQEEFQLLLGKKNINNMRVILECGIPVANMNFYKSTILIEGSPIKTATVGAVCTEATSRGKGYSSSLLDDSERLMKEDGIRLMLVSGTGRLYLRRGCTEVGKCYKFRLQPSQDIHENLQLQEYDNSKIDTIIKLYNRDNTRYYRTREEFKYLLDGATTPWSNFTYKVFLVKDSKDYCAYIILRIANEKEGKWGSVVEAAGDREILCNALEEIIRLNNLKNIEYSSTFNDASTRVLKLKDKGFTKHTLQGTVKILDFKGLMQDLMPYFAQYVDKDIIENISFSEENGKYFFSLNNEILEVQNINDLNRLVFGIFQDVALVLSNKPVLNKFINSVFPIPFVWTANLNYQ